MKRIVHNCNVDASPLLIYRRSDLFAYSFVCIGDDRLKFKIHRSIDHFSQSLDVSGYFCSLGCLKNVAVITLVDCPLLMHAYLYPGISDYHKRSLLSNRGPGPPAVHAEGLL